jgi:hypothetical protein
MMNDPLLHQPWGPPTEAAAELSASSSREELSSSRQGFSQAKRAKHPAASARILAVGFSIAAVIGMSAAYTKAQRQQPTEPEVLDSASSNQLNLAPVSPHVNETPTFQQPQNHVVQIPVPQASPATGGYAPQNQGPVQQQSNGSH